MILIEHLLYAVQGHHTLQVGLPQTVMAYLLTRPVACMQDTALGAAGEHTDEGKWILSSKSCL